MMRRLRWPLAVLLAAGLHALLLVAIEAPDTDTGARAQGEEGLVIDVAPAGAAAGAKEPTPDAGPQQTRRERPEPEPRVTERAPQTQQAPEQATDSAPEPEPKARNQPEQNAKQQADEGRASAERGEAATATDGKAGGGDPGARADYLERLRVHLERHKEYPRRARVRRMEGTVRVSFTVHADGRITGARVTEGSGTPALDEAARRMLERADPGPSFPAEMATDSLELTVPVRYSLR